MTAYLPDPSTADTTEITADSTEATLDRSRVKVADSYLSKVTPWQANPLKARFLATVRANIQPYADSQSVISTFSMLYDIDYAEGSQLDVVGEWVGRSRLVPIPLPNAFFTLGDPNLGLGKGYWKGPLDPAEGLSVLPDDLYRRLLRAKILANSWDGTSEGILLILRSYFTDLSTKIIVDDSAPSAAPIKFFSLGDPSRGLGIAIWKGPNVHPPQSFGYALKIGFSGRIPSQIDLAVLSAGLFSVKAMGTSLSILVTTVDRTPLFGLGPETASVAGLGRGAWGASPSEVAARQVD